MTKGPPASFETGGPGWGAFSIAWSLRRPGPACTEGPDETPERADDGGSDCGPRRALAPEFHYGTAANAARSAAPSPPAAQSAAGAGIMHPDA